MTMELTQAAARAHGHNPPGTLREGAGEPLVLLHGVTGSATMWRHVLPRLAPHFDTIALTLLGHRGGRPPSMSPVRVRDVIDDAERSLDELGIESAHLVGNSLGGWVALELARRGRARSVCALSPAGVWDPARRTSASGTLKRVSRTTSATRALLPWVARLDWVRRFGLRDNAVHGERVSASELVELADDLLGCVVRDDLLATSESLSPLRARCPLTIAWSAEDRLFPVAQHEPLAREWFPEARFLRLDGVGHAPMLDDPALVARTILGSLPRAETARAAGAV
jgi:pimeloyl-ACP methyl ester carboxylesterase